MSNVAKKTSQTSVSTKNKVSDTPKTDSAKSGVFAFGRNNYILLIVGVVVLLAGYFCLSGGGSDDPTKFNPALFDARRLVVAPILIVAGLVLEIFAIMIRPKNEEPQATDKPE